MSTESNIKDFSDTDVWTVRQTLNERWGKDKTDIQMAEVEIRLNPYDRDLSTVPAIFWEYESSSFIIFKIGNSDYKTQFYYKGRDQYGTAVPSFDNILDCIVTVLQVHADLERDKTQQAEK